MDLPFNVFELESYAFWKEEEQRIEEYQLLLYSITKAPHLDPKQIPKTFDLFRGKKAKVNSATLDFFNQEMEKFKELQNVGKT